MSKRQVLMILGIWVMVFLFLGFPSGWDQIFAVITGLIVVAITVSLRPEQARPHKIVQHSQQPQPQTPPQVPTSAPTSLQDNQPSNFN